MALDRLLASLEADAAAQAQAVLAEAQARVEALARTAAERESRLKAETLEARERTQRAAAELAVARARQRARARVLEARDGLLDRVFAAAETQLPAAATGPAFRAALPARLIAARACLGDAPAVLRCDATLVPVMRAALPPADTLVMEPDAAVTTGFLLAAQDGALTVDETLRSRLARRRAPLAIEVLRALDEAAP